MEANNIAAMREALEAILRYVKPICKYAKPDGEQPTALFATADTVRDIVAKALSAPARNCDMGTLTEQQQRFHDFCEKMQHTDKACCGGCPIVHLRMQGIIGNSCELAWAQMPYTAEGGGECNDNA